MSQQELAQHELAQQELTKQEPAGNRDYPAADAKPKNHSWLRFFISSLFWFGASASALQGFFSINSFILSLGAIPGMAFLYLIPYAFILVSAVIIALYSIIVEQQVFREFFERLLAQWFGVEYEDIASKEIKPTQKREDNRTYNERTHELKKKIRQLDHQPEIVDEISEQTDKDQYNLHWCLHATHRLFAYIAAGFIVGLRAVVSIGSTMLGIQVLIGLVSSPLGLTAPLGIIPLCAIISAVGYFIKVSQNLVDQFNETLKMLGLKTYVKTDYKATKKEYKQSLKRLYKAEIEPASKEHKPKHELPIWKSFICRIMDIGFVLGAFGASMQGFFSIQKFVSQMGSVPFLAFFNAIPASFIIGCSAVIAFYTLFVEQKILYQYFHSLIIGWFGSSEELYYVDYSNAPDPDDYKLQVLEKDVDYTIKEITNEANEKKYRVVFNSKEAYKIYRYNQKIDRIYSHDLLMRANILRPADRVVCQLPKQIEKKEYGFIWLNFARTGTVFILLLRAVTSVGPSVLGLAAVANLVASLFGLSLGSWIFLPCIIMASFGYIIKCSQNIDKHYLNTLRDMFGVDYTQKYQDKTKLSARLNDEHVEALELFNEHRNQLLADVRQRSLDADSPPLSPTTVTSVVSLLHRRKSSPEICTVANDLQPQAGAFEDRSPKSVLA